MVFVLVVCVWLTLVDVRYVVAYFAGCGVCDYGFLVVVFIGGL